jgi:hypothetical protein
MTLTIARKRDYGFQNIRMTTEYYGCTYCGQLLTAIVPDYVYTGDDRIKREGMSDIVPMNLKCTACKKTIILLVETNKKLIILQLLYIFPVNTAYTIQKLL